MWLCIQGVWSWISDDDEEEHERTGCDTDRTSPRQPVHGR